MWILESNGDFLQGKRMWLRPGKKYLFGRVKKNGVRFAIDHRTVSRQHFIITIDPVQDGDVGRVHVRSRITITDENSKAGTNIDGVLIRGKTQELKNSINSIRPGSCPHELIISWVPCVLTFGFSRKEIKNGSLKAKQEQIKELDIKVINDYVAGQTTHLITQKRNTSKSLQALIEGRYVVADTYIDTLIYASTPGDLEEEERLCSLEVDFDHNWPDPAPHLPPKGKEPTEKPANDYKPNPARQKIFDKYTFVFFDQTQYDQLLPAVTIGHGKALIFKPTATTNIDELLDSLKSSLPNMSHIISVKVNDVNDTISTVTNLIEQLGFKLGIEPASQSDFLDAILANDASQLRKARPQTSTNTSLPPTSNGRGTRLNGSSSNDTAAASARQIVVDKASSRPTPNPVHDSDDVGSGRTSQTEDPKRPAPIKDENPRPPKKPRVNVPRRGLDSFDDDFDPNAIAAWEDDSDVGSELIVQGHSQRQTGHGADRGAVIKNEGHHNMSHTQSESPPDNFDEEEMMDELLPAAAAMRRQKQLQEESRPNGTQPEAPAPPVKSEPFFKPTKEMKLVDVREALRARKEAEKQAQEKEEKHLLELQEEEQEHKGPANLVKINEYKLPVRQQSKAMTNGYRGKEWKPEWDGRPNYKGFRRASDKLNGNNGPSKPPEKIIVPLVLARKNTFGIGDQYWGKTQEDKDREARERERKKRANQSASQSQSENKSRSQRAQTVRGSSESESESDDASVDAHDSSIDNAASSNVSPETLRLQQEAEGVVDHPIDIDAPRRTRNADTQTQSSKSTKGAKRQASKTPPGRNLAQKRQKTLPVAVVHGSQSENDSDDSDDMKFRFGRAKKGRGVRT